MAQYFFSTEIKENNKIENTVHTNLKILVLNFIVLDLKFQGWICYTNGYNYNHETCK